MFSDIINNLETGYKNGGHAHHKEKCGLQLNLLESYNQRLTELYYKSPSQLKQDLFVLAKTNFKQGGYFVEFGAADGYTFSNTWLLEKEFNWNGILAEPAKCFHDKIKKNRSCNIELDCVWIDSNQTVLFREFNELSTIDVFTESDFHAPARRDKETYEVKTISIMDLLSKYQAPRDIDYLSIDTEGSELDILKSLDYDKYKINIITCEHNHTDARNKIRDFLYSKGYIWANENFADFDDWYILSGTA